MTVSSLPDGNIFLFGIDLCRLFLFCLFGWLVGWLVGWFVFVVCLFFLSVDLLKLVRGTDGDGNVERWREMGRQHHCYTVSTRMAVRKEGH